MFAYKVAMVSDSLCRIINNSIILGNKIFDLKPSRNTRANTHRIAITKTTMYTLDNLL